MVVIVVDDEKILLDEAIDRFINVINSNFKSMMEDLSELLELCCEILNEHNNSLIFNKLYSVYDVIQYFNYTIKNKETIPIGEPP